MSLGLHSEYQELFKIQDIYLKHRVEVAKGNKKHSGAFSANVLAFHPIVASRISFNHINDKSDVMNKETNYLDCTNSTDWLAHKQGTESNLAAFSPQLHATVPDSVFFGKRWSGALHGQWSVAFAAMAHVMRPNRGFDSRFPATGCLVQCHSVFYWAQYHSVGRSLLWLQYAPSVVQILVALTYDFTMHVLAITGFTWLFFDRDLFAQRPHSSPEQNIGMIKGRWDHFSREIGYKGTASEFPLSFEEVPAVPRCFNFDWMMRHRGVLILRMCVTLVLAAISFSLVQFGSTPLLEYASSYISF